MNEPSNFCEWPCNNPEQSEEDTDIPEKRGVKPRNAGGLAPGAVEERGVAPRQEGGLKKGLLGRNLIDPSYKINNTFGVLGNKTTSPDLIHYGGWAEYDTHNL